MGEWFFYCNISQTNKNQNKMNQTQTTAETETKTNIDIMFEKLREQEIDKKLSVYDYWMLIKSITEFGSTEFSAGLHKGEQIFTKHLTQITK